MPPDFQTGQTWRMLLIERIELGKRVQLWYKEDKYYYFIVVISYIQLEV